MQSKISFCLNMSIALCLSGHNKKGAIKQSSGKAFVKTKECVWPQNEYDVVGATNMFVQFE